MVTPTPTHAPDNRPAPPVPEGVSLHGVLQMVRRRKLLLVLPLLASLLYFGYVAWTAEPYYESSTVLLAEQLDDYEALEPGAPVWISDHIGAIRELVHRPSFLATLAERFELYELENGRVPTEAIADLSSRVWVNQEGEDTFSMGFTGDDPEQVAAVTAGMSELFIQYMEGARNTRADAVNEVVERELEVLEERLAEQEAQIAAYKRRSGQALPENLSVLVAEASALRGDAQAQASEISALEAERQQVRAELTALDRRGLAQRDPEVEELRARLAELRKRYTEEHPEVVRARQQLEALEETRATSSGSPARDTELRIIQLEAQAEALDQKIAAGRAQLGDIRSRIASYEGQIASMPQREQEMSELMRDYEVTQEAYDELLGRRHYTQVTHALSRSSRGLTFVVVDPARVPTAPAGPERWRPILLGLVIGLGVGGTLMLLTEQMDTTLDDLEEVERAMPVPALAAIPSLAANGKAGNKRRPPIPSLTDPASTPAEQYRILGYRVRRMMDDSGARTLMVTSGSGNEGKTTTAANLACALSEQAPGQVLLVDADLRRPRIHEYLSEHLSDDQSVRGLRYLLEHRDTDLGTHAEKIRNLAVIADREPVSDGAACLSADGRAVLERLAEEYRYVVLDAPPVLPMVDAHLLAEITDGALFVVRARQTPREVVQRCLEIFDFSHTLGVVVNDVELRGKRYAQAYDYYEKQYARSARGGATA